MKLGLGKAKSIGVDNNFDHMSKEEAGGSI